MAHIRAFSPANRDVSPAVSGLRLPSVPLCK